ncbi:hypothetical protein [Streptomyces sp. NPDC057702]|uniref:hypothetical protein n=1 Tax=unclassified Streptomyces TaxID=2593676 RepID=UPI00368BADE1
MSTPPQQPGPGHPDGSWPPGQPGTGGHPGPVPYGYPQQAAPYGEQGQRPAYGQPPPHGQPGYGGQPPGYGAPYGGAPGPGGGPPRGGAGRTVAVVVGAVLAAALVVGGVVLAVSGGDDGGKRDESQASGAPGAGADASADADRRPGPDRTTPTPSARPDEAASRHTVVLPRTLENGRYTLEKDLSDATDAQVPDDGRNARGVKPTTGRYLTAPRDAELVVTGLSGTFGSPEYAKNSFFQGLESNDNAEVVVERRDITPPGSDTTLTCEVVVKRQGSQRLVLPMCAWADTRTLVAVVENTRAAAGKDPHSLDLDGFAARVDGMRDDLLA